jgi:hypothetical protein
LEGDEMSILRRKFKMSNMRVREQDKAFQDEENNKILKRIRRLSNMGIGKWQRILKETPRDDEEGEEEKMNLRRIQLTRKLTRITKKWRSGTG